jgi:ribosomal protein L22
VSPEKDQTDETRAAADTTADEARALDEQPAAEKREKAPAKGKRARAKDTTTGGPVAEGASEAEEAPEASEASETSETEETPQKAASPRRRRVKKAADAAPAGEAATAAKPAKPAPARRSAKGAKRPQRRRVVRAQARYVRTSARKARLVSDHLRGRSVQEARAILAYAPREVARDWSKLLDSAVANAENNHELLEDDLIVRDAYADEGPTIKRFRPRAMGRATSIRKRTSHLTITLTPDI